MKTQKTNAMRILDKAKLSYEVFTYDHGKEAVSGIEVAKQLGQDPKLVYKTLITCSNTKEYLVFVIPVEETLDLKKCAKSAHVKSVDMIPVKQINALSGYIRGGCSPIGMKKAYRTFLHESCLTQDTIMFSGGKIGCQIAMNPQALLKLLHAEAANLIQA